MKFTTVVEEQNKVENRREDDEDEDNNTSNHVMIYEEMYEEIVEEYHPANNNVRAANETETYEPHVDRLESSVEESEQSPLDHLQINTDESYMEDASLSSEHIAKGIFHDLCGEMEKIISAPFDFTNY